MLLAMLSDIPIFFAARLTRSKQLKLIDFLIPLSACLIFGITFIYFPRDSDYLTFSLVSATIVGFAISLYFFTGLRKFYRAKEDTVLKFFIYTFLFYALLQPLFLLALTEFRGSLIYIHFIALGVKTLNFGLLGYMVFRDSTKSYTDKELTHFRSVSTAAAQRTGENIDELAKVLQHEIKIPVMLMAEKIHDLKRAYQSDLSLTKELDEINNQRQRILTATQLINVLEASVATISTDLIQLHLKSELNNIIKEIKTLLKTDVLGITFEVLEKKQQLFIRVHRELIRFAFLNILKNAVEAVKPLTKNGNIKITLGLADNNSSQVLISFQDNGIGLPEGISEEELKKLGTSFNKNNASLDRSNHGVGLFVSDHIIKIHGGKLTVKASKKAGAEINVFLPRDETKKQRAGHESDA
jgi:signal transduction histidine kinase